MQLSIFRSGMNYDINCLSVSTDVSSTLEQSSATPINPPNVSTVPESVVQPIKRGRGRPRKIKRDIDPPSSGNNSSQVLTSSVSRISLKRSSQSSPIANSSFGRVSDATEYSVTDLSSVICSSQGSNSCGRNNGINEPLKVEFNDSREAVVLLSNHSSASGSPRYLSPKRLKHTNRSQNAQSDDDAPPVFIKRAYKRSSRSIYSPISPIMRPKRSPKRVYSSPTLKTPPKNNILGSTGETIVARRGPGRPRTRPLVSTAKFEEKIVSEEPKEELKEESPESDFVNEVLLQAKKAAIDASLRLQQKYSTNTDTSNRTTVGPRIVYLDVSFSDFFLFEVSLFLVSKNPRRPIIFIILIDGY